MTTGGLTNQAGTSGQPGTSGQSGPSDPVGTPGHSSRENTRRKVYVAVSILGTSAMAWLLCSIFHLNTWITIFEIIYQIINTFLALLQIHAVQQALTKSRRAPRRVLPSWLSPARIIARISPRGSFTVLAFAAIILFGTWNLWLCFHYHLDGQILALSILLGALAVINTFLWLDITRNKARNTIVRIKKLGPIVARADGFIEKMSRNVFLLGLLLFGSGFWNIALNHIADACNGAATQEIVQGIGAVVMGRECIGISDGGIAFDTDRPDGDLKLKAASAIRKSPHNVTATESLLIEALNKDPGDAEAAIYLEDLRIRSNPRHVTLVVETLLSGAYISDGRDVLQGAAVEQKENNDRCNSAPDCIYLNILIANVGSGYVDEADYTNMVAEQMLQAENDPTFIGVMDGLSSQAALNINSILATAPHPLPIVAAKATTDYARGRYYFFRVTPFDLEEARLATNYIQNTLNAKRIAILFRKENVFSGDIVQDLRGMFPPDQLVDVEQYQERDSSSITQALKNALAKNPDLLYCSCYASEVSVVLEHLPTTGPQAHLKVMGGDALYELGDYTPEAKSSLNRLLFTALAYPEAWQRFGPTAALPDFFADYNTMFRRTFDAAPPTGGVITSYDAMLTLVTAATRAFTTSTQSLSSTSLYNAMLTITGKQAIQGISGQISFSAQGSSKGDPFQKAIFLLTFDAHGDVEYVDMCGQFLVNGPIEQSCDTPLT